MSRIGKNPVQVPAGVDVTIEGAGGIYDGVRLENTGVSSNGGNLSIDGIGGEFGVYVSYYAGLQSGGGDIIVHGLPAVGGLIAEAKLIGVNVQLVGPSRRSSLGGLRGCTRVNTSADWT